MDEIVNAPIAFARWGSRTLAEDRHAYCLKLWNLLTPLLPKFPPGHRSHGRLNAGLPNKLSWLLNCANCCRAFAWSSASGISFSRMFKNPCITSAFWSCPYSADWNSGSRINPAECISECKYSQRLHQSQLICSYLTAESFTPGCCSLVPSLSAPSSSPIKNMA